MALAQGVARSARNRGIESFVATPAVVFYAGAVVALNVSNGLAVLWSDSASRVLLGIAERDLPITGITTVVNEVNINTSGPILERLSVVGVTGQPNLNDQVYATDDGTFTLTATVNVKSIGRIVRFHTGLIVDVRTHTPAEYMLLP